MVGSCYLLLGLRGQAGAGSGDQRKGDVEGAAWPGLGLPDPSEDHGNPAGTTQGNTFLHLFLFLFCKNLPVASID